MSTSILQIIFGAFIISGDNMCRSIFLETLRFAVYCYSSCAIMLISAFRSIDNDNIYNEVIYNLSISHYDLPYYIPILWL